MATEDVLIKWRSDLDEVKRDLAAIRKDFDGIDKDGKKAQKSIKGNMGVTKSLNSQFKKLAAAAAAAFATERIIRFGKEAINAASDLNETITKTQALFGDASDGVIAWSENSAQAFGMSKQAALDAASTYAVFGKSAGLAGDDLESFSTNLTELSTDFASFFNSSPEEAVQAIGAALRGESEPIRRYGVLLDAATLKQRALKMGLIETTKGALTPQARVLAAQAEIFAQAGDAQGDFARTSEGMANQSRIASAQFKNLTAELGENLLPVATDTLKLVNTMLEGINGTLKGMDKIRAEAREDVVREAVERVAEAYREQGDVILSLSENEVAMQKRRIETGIMNIDQLEMEKEVLGEVRSEAIKMTAAQRVQALKRLNQAQAEVEAIKKVKKEQEGYDVTVQQADENTIQGIQATIKALQEEAKTIDINSQHYRDLLGEIDRLQQKIKDASEVGPSLLDQLNQENEAARKGEEAALAYWEAFFGEQVAQNDIPQEDMSLNIASPSDREEMRALYEDFGLSDDEYTRLVLENAQKRLEALKESMDPAQYAAISEGIQAQLDVLEGNALSATQEVLGGFSAMSESLLQIFQTNAEAGTQAAEFQKQLTLFTIAVQTAEALARVVALAAEGAAGTGPAAIGAFIAQLAAGTALVLSNIARAKSIITADTPTPPQFERGGWVGGRRHSRGGTLIEAELNEFVVSRKPAMRYKDALEAINKGKFEDYVNSTYFKPLQATNGNDSIGKLANVLADELGAGNHLLRRISRSSGVQVTNVDQLAKAIRGNGGKLDRFKA